MPAFYTRPRGGLITPPGSEMYGHRNMGSTQYGQNNRKPVYDAQPYIAPPAPIMYQPTMQYNNMPTVPPPGMSRASYGPIGQPTLPPLVDRHPDVSRHDYAQEQQRQPAVKQEKVVGGVAQDLDYEMDQMTDYVAEMAQEIVMPRSKVSPAFRKFVSQLLSSTRLPSSTILLGLNYLAKRMSMLNTPTPYKTTDGQVWRMLTIALLLGSKFLDDNTFQNRSWSEVSGIPVKELNTLESEWLVAISWNLHVDPITDSDFQCWLASWASWKDTRNKQRTATLDRLAPLAQIDTNVQRHGSQRKEYSPSYAGYGDARSENRHSYYPPQGRYDQTQWPQTASDLSPPSAPDSGPNTPEWALLPGSGLPPSEWYGYSSMYNRRPVQQSTVPMSYMLPPATAYHAPYQSNYSQSTWNGHPAGCPCGYCGNNTEAYFMSSGYGQQTVAG